MDSDRDAGDATKPGMWRDPGFRLFFLADAASFAGSRITRVVLSARVGDKPAQRLTERSTGSLPIEAAHAQRSRSRRRSPRT